MRAQTTMTPLWKLMRDNDAGPTEILFHFRVTRPPVDVRDLAVRLGVDVRDSAQGLEGLVRSTESSARIEVNPSTSRSRQRFTIAHELGHLMLHPLGVKHRDTSVLQHDSVYPRIEREANAFAADLLMPAWMVERFAKTWSGDPRQLGSLFEVSPKAMEIRLRQLFPGRFR